MGLEETDDDGLLNNREGAYANPEDEEPKDHHPNIAPDVTNQQDYLAWQVWSGNANYPKMGSTDPEK